MLLTIIFSFFYNVFKHPPFLGCQNSGLFRTKSYIRGIDFLCWEKKNLQPLFAGMECMVID